MKEKDFEIPTVPDTERIKKMAEKLDLPADYLKKLGFVEAAERKAEEDLAEELLNEKITNLIERVMEAGETNVGPVEFRLPKYDLTLPGPRLDPDLFRRIFSRRANTVNEEGGKVPIQIMEGKQLDLYSRSYEIREGGSETYEIKWFLGLASYNPEEESKPKSF